MKVRMLTAAEEFDDAKADATDPGRGGVEAAACGFEKGPL